MSMKIYPIHLKKRAGNIYVSSEIEASKGRKELWFSLPEKYEKYIMYENLDSILLGVLFYAMQNQEDIILFSPISEKLYYNLTNYYLHILTLQIPYLHKIELHAPTLDNSLLSDRPQAVATGFSGGVDAFCTFIDHFNETIPEQFRLTHLTFHNVGSHRGNNEQERRNLFQERYKLVKNFADEMGIELILIDSNLNEFFPARSFNPNHSIRNVAPIMLLQKLFAKYYYSSSHKYEECFVGPAGDMSYHDPISLQLLSTENLEFLSVGNQYSRAEKTKKISEFEPTYRHLNVCWIDQANNCSQCEKCLRTLLTLELIGKLDKYRNIFDLELYKKVRDYFILKINQNKQDYYYKDILDYAEELGIKLRPRMFTTIKKLLKDIKWKYKNLKKLYTI